MSEKFETNVPDHEGGAESAEFRVGDLVTIAPGTDPVILEDRGAIELGMGGTYKILKIEEVEGEDEEDGTVFMAHLGAIDTNMALLNQFSTGSERPGLHYPVSYLETHFLKKTTVH